MSILCKDYSNAIRQDIECELANLRMANKIDPETQDIILNHLCGYYDSHSESELRVVYRVNPYIKKTAAQRINTLWFFPLYMLLVAPIKYIITGETGVDRYSKIGRLIERIIGCY